MLPTGEFLQHAFALRDAVLRAALGAPRAAGGDFGGTRQWRRHGAMEHAGNRARGRAAV